MKFHSFPLLWLPLLLSCSFTGKWGEPPGSGVRQAAFAGQFYPSDPARLRLAIEKFMEEARPALGGQPVAILAPHAGYLYAGPLIADAYSQVKSQAVDTVMILGTNHGRNMAGARLTGVSVYAGGAYRTPLGEAPVDAALARELMAADSDCSSQPEAQAAEHSIEVQVPFIQVLFPQARILPLMIGRPDPALCERLGKAIARISRGRSVLLVASADLSHFPRYEDAAAADLDLLDSIVPLSPDRFLLQIRSRMSRGTPGIDTCTCGEGPILAAMAAARAMGAERAAAVSYANSGDIVAEDRSRVVGYGSAVFLRGGTPAGNGLRQARKVSGAPGPLTAGDKEALLRLARKSLQRFLSTDTVPLARDLSDRLKVPQGAFVTLHQKGRLRGCIGRLGGDFPLALAVSWMAVQAGTADSRFAPVTLQELDSLEIEISAMTPMQPIARASEIVVGKDGVVLRKAGRSAVFLPQVATEQGWGLTELLDNLSLKAGLPRDAWRSGARFQVFQAEVFGEARSGRKP